MLRTPAFHVTEMSRVKKSGFLAKSAQPLRRRRAAAALRSVMGDKELEDWEELSDDIKQLDLAEEEMSALVRHFYDGIPVLTRMQLAW
eukprot:7788428-Pyramimonas_sp.AAC.1